MPGDSILPDPHSTAGAKPLPQRSRPAHGVVVSAADRVLVYVTVCTKDRAPWLADENVHQALRFVWQGASAWRVGRYVVMPDHVHLFAAPGTPELPLENWMSYWKSQFTRRHAQPIHRWQAGHWDRRLRTGESYDEKWQYVLANPVRQRLVERADEWPYQGELNLLEW